MAIEWPGWSRSGRGEEQALEALLAYAERYAAVAADAGGEFHMPGDVSQLRVVERLEGGATTDFGAPGSPPAADDRPLTGQEPARQAALLQASWRAFDRAAGGAQGRELRRGPRGGGRDLEKMRRHVLEAEEGYLRQLGGRQPRHAPGADVGAVIGDLRQTVLATLEARARGEEPADPSRVRKRWSPRYFVRRAAWHVLDHAWEIEDRIT